MTPTHIQGKSGRSPRAGIFVPQPTGYSAFHPATLPPDPPIALTGQLAKRLSDADIALGRLDGVTGILPNPDLFLAMYVKREAVLSSQIEGTQASLTDVLQFEVSEEDGDDERLRDVHEVVNYVEAMNYGLKRMESLPLSLRLIKEIHEHLMRGVRGDEKHPGEFRRSPVWIGPAGCTLSQATFVPPPHELVLGAMGNLEGFIRDDSYPPLLQAGLAHAQFETIHPFNDGNGRVGRLLVTFMLCHHGVLSRPLLYLSLYLKGRRAEYYDRLQAVRTDGAWEQWLDFFLRGVVEVATAAHQTARAILALREQGRAVLSVQGKASSNLLRALDTLFARPIVTPNSMARSLGVSYVTANGVISRLEELGLLRELTGFKRNRRYTFHAYLDLFEEAQPFDAGSSPLPKDSTQPESRPDSGDSIESGS